MAVPSKVFHSAVKEPANMHGEEFRIHLRLQLPVIPFRRTFAVLFHTKRCLFLTSRVLIAVSTRFYEINKLATRCVQGQRLARIKQSVSEESIDLSHHLAHHFNLGTVQFLALGNRCCLLAILKVKRINLRNVASQAFWQGRIGPPRLYNFVCGKNLCHQRWALVTLQLREHMISNDHVVRQPHSAIVL
jgi:hypothetical protein